MKIGRLNWFYIILNICIYLPSWNLNNLKWILSPYYSLRVFKEK